MKDAHEDRIFKEITRRYGTMIDLESSPDAIIDIIREFGPQVDNTTLHPPSPTTPSMRDILNELQRLSRDIGSIKKHLGLDV